MNTLLLPASLARLCLWHSASQSVCGSTYYNVGVQSGYLEWLQCLDTCGCSSVVEPQLPKLMTRVRFSSPALVGIAASNPALLLVLFEVR